MGTRHCIKIISNNKVKVQQYGQWDGYPTGQGKDIVDFLMGGVDVPEFKSKVEPLKFYNSKDLAQMQRSVFINPDNPEFGSGEAERYFGKYPWLSRDCGARLLMLIYKGHYIGENLCNYEGSPVTRKKLTKGFKVDGTTKCPSKDIRDWCEYVYTINLDDNTLKVAEVGGRSKVFKFSELTKDSMDKLEGLWNM